MDSHRTMPPVSYQYNLLVTVTSGRHLRLRSIPTTWPGLEHVMGILNNLLQDNATPPQLNTQPTQLPGCHESATSLLPVWPLAFPTACLQFLPSMFLFPLSSDFCHIVSPTTHVFHLWLHYLYTYHNSHYCHRFLSLCNSHFFSARLALLGLQWWYMS
jgi:hypothetical protein